jgi:hypothetical protein
MSDKASDDAYGQGIKSFGGVWNVQQVAATSSAPASSGGRSSGGGGMSRGGY